MTFWLLRTRWYRHCAALWPRDTWTHACLRGYLFWGVLLAPLNLALIVWCVWRMVT